MAVFKVRVGNRLIDVYDLPLSYPSSRRFRGNPAEIIKLLHVPSYHYYYLSRNGKMIPYSASPFTDTFAADLDAWYVGLESIPVIYALNIFEASDDPAINLIDITEGKRLIHAEFKHYNDLKHYLRVLNSERPAEERFALSPIEISQIRLMFSHPFNPEANFIKVSHLAYNRDREEIQKYLDEIGIITFTADDIVRLGEWDIFFYLTRFYGPPVSGDLEIQVIQRNFLKRVQNSLTRSLIDLFDPEVYTRIMDQFETIFEHFNNYPKSDYYKQLGAFSIALFKASPWSYLKLLYRPENLPILTLNTIRQLRTDNWRDVRTFLKNYTDQEIINLIGDPSFEDINWINRNQFLSTVAETLLTRRSFLLTPQEAELCNNEADVATMERFAESGEAFIAKGSLMNGFDCYNIQELFRYFEATKDEEELYLFPDPLRTGATFSVRDLQDFHATVMAGRAGVILSREVIERFAYYVEQADLQAQMGIEQLQVLRRFVEVSLSNKELIADVFRSFFYIGMYMRQWIGPGHPYPLLVGETGETTEDLAPERVSQNITEENARLLNLLEKLPNNIREIFWNLDVVYRREGRVYPIGRKIRERHDAVMYHGFCVRMASAPWAFTGAYYYKQILKEDIPGFSLDVAIEFIY